jgi:hypothetical protein
LILLGNKRTGKIVKKHLMDRIHSRNISWILKTIHSGIKKMNSTSEREVYTKRRKSDTNFLPPSSQGPTEPVDTTKIPINRLPTTKFSRRSETKPEFMESSSTLFHMEEEEEEEEFIRIHRDPERPLRMLSARPKKPVRPAGAALNSHVDSSGWNNTSIGGSGEDCLIASSRQEIAGLQERPRRAEEGAKVPAIQMSTRRGVQLAAPIHFSQRPLPEAQPVPKTAARGPEAA